MPLSNMVRKTNFLSISVLVSEIDSFMTKKKSSLWISPKILQNNRRHSLAMCGSLFGEKQFLLIFILYYCFFQNHLFKQIHIFLRICPFSNMVRITNRHCTSVLLSAIVTFMLKEKFSLNFLPNASKQQKGIV